MEKRHLLFWVLVAIIWVGWMRYMEVQHARQIAARKAILAKQVAAAPQVKDERSQAPAQPPPVQEQPESLVENLVLGQDEWRSDDIKYEMFAKLTNAGAAVTYLHLNSYDGETRDSPLVLLGNGTAETEPSFRLSIDNEPGESLATKTWKVVEEARGPAKIAFSTKALGGKLEVEKKFMLDERSNVIRLQIVFTNLTDQAIEDFTYTLTGGNGVPIEGAWYSQFFRRMVVAHLGATPRFEERTVIDIVDHEEKQQPIRFPVRREDRLRFAGIASQYFASLVVQAPPDDERSYLASATAITIGKADKPALTNIAVKLSSNPLRVPAHSQVTHEYQLYNGPKDKRVLANYSAWHLPEIVHYPDFLILPIGWISQVMVKILDFFEGLIGDYGIAIILLTIVVRGAMAPLTFRQTKTMQRLQEKMAVIQPQLEELKQKYKNDKQRLNREIMELYGKHNLSPLAPLGGCLPLFLQLPIFIGLYQALYNSFSLRHSTFLYGLTWIKDLSAPDQLITWNADLWAIGKSLNVLPIISVAQMLIQMRIASPPATTPEQLLQRRMITFMMVFMGFLFYKIPAGLCVYIITSSLWSMAERQFLPKPATAPGAGPAVSGALAATPTSSSTPKSGNGASWISPFRPKKKGKTRR
jgi:YidC/Oxa1 family membrane protein insertase